MSWPPFILLAWLFLGLEAGLGPHLVAGSGQHAPAFTIPLLVFVALNAPARTAIWSALLLGLATDLTKLGTTYTLAEGGTLQLVGPHAIAYAVAAQLVVSVRGMVLTRNLITPIILNFFGSLIAGFVVTAIFTIRLIYADPIEFSPASALLGNLFAALFTAAAGIPLVFILAALMPFFHFPSQHSQHHVTHARAFKR